jgi:hypothetical protein
MRVFNVSWLRFGLFANPDQAAAILAFYRLLLAEEYAHGFLL